MGNEYTETESMEQTPDYIAVRAKSDFSTFKQYFNLAEQLLEKTSKDDIAVIARLLALNLAHYQSRYGELTLEETLAMIEGNIHSEDQVKLLTDGMEILVGTLCSVVSVPGLNRYERT